MNNTVQTFSEGPGAPTPGMGADGNTYEDTTSGRIWSRYDGTWINTGMIPQAPISSPSSGTATIVPAAPAAPTTPAHRLQVGIYVGDAHDALHDYVAWMGKPPDMASVHVGQDSSNGMISVDYDMWVNDVVWRYVNPPWTAADRVNLCVSQPNVFTGMTLEMTAAGQNDGNILEAAHHLFDKVVSYHEQDLTFIRPDWEENGGWMNEWKTQNDPASQANYIVDWKKMHDIYTPLDVGNKLRWVFCPNIGQDNPELTYPGDAYVDVLSIDMYWQPEFGDPTDPVAAFNFMRDRDFGLQWQVNFAKAHNKGLAISEWGIKLDEPKFVLLILQWCLDHGYIFANYWESNAAFTAALTPDPATGVSQYPNAAAAYKTAILKIQSGATRVCDAGGNPV